uniref:Uncharacterized protein n=1 Tax=Solanum lycopersicum TaxID=4081 RepID=A0A3Q7G8Q9_SOLLC
VINIRRKKVTLESSPAEAEVERRSILATNLFKGEGFSEARFFLGFYISGFVVLCDVFGSPTLVLLIRQMLEDPAACSTADFSSGVDACKTVVVCGGVEEDRALQLFCSRLH